MSSCPFCKIALTQAALASGRCPGCGRTLPPDGAAGQPAGDDTAGKQGAGPTAKKEIARTLDAGHLDEKPPAEEGSGTADEKRVMETLDAGKRDERPPAEEDVGTADEKQVMKTLDAGRRDERPPAEEDVGTADEKRVMKTLDAGKRDELPPAEEDGGTAEEEARKVADFRLAETYDSDAIPPDAAENLSAMWRNAMQQDVTPRQTIKTDLHSVVADSKLIVQSRVVRGRGEPAKARADYELMDLLGKGGMGIVYAARQASLDRTVAVKMLRPEKADDKRQWQAFLSEAVVTGDLEHPNIVPIYDLGIGEKDALFYSMKRVKGIAWSDVLAEKPLGENLEILMRVADAIAFAHSKGVIHRDLKPENIMLGDYGEVLLMDWGLAMSLTRRDGSGMGGTPAYMAPEMATGPVERLGVHSDVYLLGAMLFEILTGKPPHAGKNVQLCLMAVSRNIIEPTDQSGELLDIALKAMATRPKDRYESVQAFQAAIRQYQSHSESNLLAERAERDLGEAKRSDDYRTFARALFGFQEALALWSGNARAQQGVIEASVAYADSALRKGDYDLGASLLDPAHPAQAGLYRKIKAAEAERNARERRLKATKRTALALLLTVLVVVTAAFFIALHLRGVADQQRGVAEEQRGIAVAERAAAEKSEAAAVKAKVVAEEAQQKEAVARQEADTQRAAAVQSEAVAIQAKDAAEEAQQKEAVARQKAETAQAKEAVARQQEEYGAYVARIGLIAANIDENAFDRARELLSECPESLRGWEWNRLNYLCTRAFRQFDAEQPVEVVAYVARWATLRHRRLGTDRAGVGRRQQPTAGRDDRHGSELRLRAGLFARRRPSGGRQQRQAGLSEDLQRRRGDGSGVAARPRRRAGAYRRRGQRRLLARREPPAVEFLRRHGHPLGPADGSVARLPRPLRHGLVGRVFAQGGPNRHRQPGWIRPGLVGRDGQGRPAVFGPSGAGLFGGVLARRPLRGQWGLRQADPDLAAQRDPGVRLRLAEERRRGVSARVSGADGPHRSRSRPCDSRPTASWSSARATTTRCGSGTPSPANNSGTCGATGDRSPRASSRPTATGCSREATTTRPGCGSSRITSGRWSSAVASCRDTATTFWGRRSRPTAVGSSPPAAIAPRGSGTWWVTNARWCCKRATSSWRRGGSSSPTASGS